MNEESPLPSFAFVSIEINKVPHISYIADQQLDHATSFEWLWLQTSIMSGNLQSLLIPQKGAMNSEVFSYSAHQKGSILERIHYSQDTFCNIACKPLCDILVSLYHVHLALPHQTHHSDPTYISLVILCFWDHNTIVHSNLQHYTNLGIPLQNDWQGPPILMMKKFYEVKEHTRYIYDFNKNSRWIIRNTHPKSKIDLPHGDSFTCNLRCCHKLSMASICMIIHHMCLCTI